jgi:multicomponent Na+:H+ antiporter subunit F
MALRSLLFLIVHIILALGALGCLLRLILGPDTATRLVALNVLSGLVLAFLVALGVEQGQVLYLDVALVYAIFGFLGFLAIARFVKEKE